MSNTITATIAELELASPQSHKNLHLFPLLDPDAPSAFEYDYLMFSDARSQGLAHITETTSDDSEPALCLHNESHQAVLFLDEEQLAGDTKKHSLVSSSVLAPAGCETRIPVDDLFAAPARSAESTSHDPETDEYIDAFGTAHNQVGTLIAIGSQVTGIELYDRPSTYAAQQPWLIKRYAKKAITSKYNENPPRPGDARRFLENLSRHGRSTGLLDNAGLGKTLWLEIFQVTITALIVDRRIVHLTGSFAEHRTARAGRSALKLTPKSDKQRVTKTAYGTI